MTSPTPSGYPFGADSLTPEAIAETDAIRLVGIARDLVTKFGVEQHITTRFTNPDDSNESHIIDATVAATTQFDHIDVAGVTYRARLARFTGKDADKYGTDVYLVLDKTSDHELVVDEITLVRFEVGDREHDIPGLYSRRGVNNQLDIITAQNILKNIRAKEEAEQQKLVSVRDAEKQQAADERARKWRRRGEVAVNAARWTGIALGSAALVGGVVFGVSRAIEAGEPDCDEACEREIIATYDRETAPLTEGVVVPVGAEAAPGYSPRALQDDRLGAGVVPELFSESDIDTENPDAGGKTADAEGSLSGPRIIRLTTSKSNTDGKGYCETVYVDLDKPTDKVVAVTPDEDRANEFRVAVEPNSVTVCWDGEERDGNDDPFVIVQEAPEQDASAVPRQGRQVFVLP